MTLSVMNGPIPLINFASLQKMLCRIAGLMETNLHKIGDRGASRLPEMKAMLALAMMKEAIPVMCRKILATILKVTAIMRACLVRLWQKGTAVMYLAAAGYIAEDETATTSYSCDEHAELSEPDLRYRVACPFAFLGADTVRRYSYNGERVQFRWNMRLTLEFNR